MNNFLNKIREEKEHLSGQFLTPPKELEYLQKFLSNNRFNSLNSIIKIDLCNLVIAFLCSNSNLDFEKVKKVITASETLFSFETEKYEKAIHTINYFLEYDKKIPIALKDKKYEEKAAKFYKYLQQENDIAGINELLIEDYEIVMDILALVETIKSMLDEKIYIEKKVRQFNSKLSQKSIDRIYFNSMKDLFNIENIKKSIQSIEQYYFEQEKYIKSHNVKLKKEIANYEQFEKEFRQQLSKPEIKDVDKLLNLIANPDLKKEFLIEVYNHNLQLWQETTAEYYNLSEDHTNQIKILFNKYNLNCADFNIDYSILTLSELECFLKIITKLNIKDFQTINFIIKNSSPEILETIYNLIQNNVITNEFLLNNLNILNKDYSVSMYPTLIKNIKELQSEQLNPKLLVVTPEVLLTDHELFSRNLNLLTAYKLNEVFKNASTYNFLTNTNLAAKLDKILELGFDKNLKENLDFLNYDFTAWNNALVYKLIGEDLSNTETLIKVLDGPNCSEYIFNYINYLDPAISNQTVSFESLTTYENPLQPLIYNINGVIISKNKIKRIYFAQGKLKIKDIVKNSILSEDEFNSLLEGLTLPNQKIINKKS